MRRYTKQEVAEILRLAADAEAPAADDAEAFTLEEVQRAGAELGVDPGRVAEAAGRVERRGSSVEGWIFETTRDLPRLAEEAAWEAMVDELRARLQVPGAVRMRADGSREWLGTSGSTTYTVLLATDEGGSRIRLRADARTSRAIVMSLATTFGIVALMGVLEEISRAVLSGPSVLGFVALALFGPLLLLGAVPLARRHAERKGEEIARHLAEVAALHVEGSDSARRVEVGAAESIEERLGHLS